MSLVRFSYWTSLIGIIALTTACANAATHETHDGLTQISYAPANGKGPVVIVISGALGTGPRQEFSARLAKEGYFVVLLNGRDIRPWDYSGKEILGKVIQRAQQSPHAVPGRAAVVAFSYGGGAALTQAATMFDVVSVVITYYPYTSFIGDDNELAAGFRVPILILAGEQDRFNNCCVIEKARAIEAAARARNAPLTLVTYPGADHGFDLAGPAYRGADEADAWKRTLAMLREHHRR